MLKPKAIGERERRTTALRRTTLFLSPFPLVALFVLSLTSFTQTHTYIHTRPFFTHNTHQYTPALTNTHSLSQSLLLQVIALLLFLIASAQRGEAAMRAAGGRGLSPRLSPPHSRRALSPSRSQRHARGTWRPRGCPSPCRCSPSNDGTSKNDGYDGMSRRMDC